MNENKEEFDEDLEEEEISTEGYCDGCDVYCDDLTKCPEHFHELDHGYCEDAIYCSDCCKALFDDKECHMNCDKKFIKKYLDRKFVNKCDELGLIKSEKINNAYLNEEKTFFVIPNKDIPSKFKDYVPVYHPLNIDKYWIVKDDDGIYRYLDKEYNLLYYLLKYKFDECLSFSLISNEYTSKYKTKILMLSGDMISGFLKPTVFDSYETEDDFKSWIKRSFTDDMLTGIDIFRVDKEIEKYCSVSQSYCHEHIKYQGKDSYFVACPFNPENYLRFASRLKSKLKDKDMKVILPIEVNEDFPDTGILFCKICQMILSTNSIICEITELNQNVMFEAGYAIGLGKYCHFLVDKSFDPDQRSELDLINDQIKTYYIDEDDCAEKFETKDEDISHYLPIRPTQFDKKYIMEWEDSKNKILFILPENDLYTKIDSEIRNTINSKYKIIDTKSINVHKLINYYNKIQEAEFVIGVLLSDRYPQKELKNSKISFLLGLSLALDKKVIIFQELPARKKIIDFKNMGQEFTDKEDLIKLLGDFFN